MRGFSVSLETNWKSRYYMQQQLFTIGLFRSCDALCEPNGGGQNWRTRSRGRKLLRVGGSAVCSRDARPPFQQFLAGVIFVNNHLNETETILLRAGRCCYCLHQLLLCVHLYKRHTLRKTFPVRTNEKKNSHTVKQFPVEKQGRKGHLGSPTFSFSVVYGVNKTSVVPILYHIVGSVMDLHFYRVASVVDEEDDGLLTASQHGRHILCSHLHLQKP